MKKLLLFPTLLLSTVLCFAQVSYDGLYIAKTGRVEAANIDIYTYLRFYRDGSVYLQAVSEHDPVAINRWFGRYKKYSQKGTYQVNGSTISIDVNNKETEDFKLEGFQETKYKGNIKTGNQLCLTQGAETKENCFAFNKVADSTFLKYSSYKPELKLTGEWRVKQVLQASRQIIFTNEDSTELVIAVLPASKLPFHKETQTAFESATAYYEWDAKYMRDEAKMQVTKINENKEKAYVIWHAKDENNDNYFLFARDKDLLYNIMVFDKTMSLEKKIALLEAAYASNK